MAEQVKRPRPFSLAAGVAMATIGIGSIVGAWTNVDGGGLAALALLLSGVAALAALATRRAPSVHVEPE